MNEELKEPQNPQNHRIVNKSNNEIGDLMGFSNLNVDSEKDYGTSVQAPKEIHVKLGGGVENFKKRHNDIILSL